MRQQRPFGAGQQQATTLDGGLWEAMGTMPRQMELWWCDTLLQEQVKPRRPTSPAGFCDLRATTMVIVKRRRRRKQSNLENKHDFSKDKERCAIWGMRRRVWEDTHVPCPGEPYSIPD